MISAHLAEKMPAKRVDTIPERPKTSATTNERYEKVQKSAHSVTAAAEPSCAMRRPLKVRADATANEKPMMAERTAVIAKERRTRGRCISA